MNKKETIRENHLYKEGLSVNKSPVGKKIQASAFGAMDEWAKEVSIEFLNWLTENKKYFHRDKNLWDCVPFMIGSDENVFTTEQLFEQYKTEKGL